MLGESAAQQNDRSCEKLFIVISAGLFQLLKPTGCLSFHFILYRLTPLHIAILSNEKAGKGKALQCAHAISEILSLKGIKHKIYSDIWPADFSAHSDIWIAGGDGTLHFFINHYPDIRKPLAIFPCGTGNDFAYEMYGRVSIQQQVERILSAPVKPVDAIQCNDRICINAAGIGFDGQILKDMDLIRYIGGHAGYLLAVLKNIFSFREYRFAIQSEVFSADEKFLLVMINNTRKTGGGFLVAPIANLNDGLLDVLLVEPIGIGKRLLNLSKIKSGTHYGLPFVKHFQCTSISIRASKPLFAHLDGELVCNDYFEFEVMKNKFNFRY